VIFEIEDDGAGIDWDAVRKVAAAHGLPHKTEQDLFEAICHDGVSTRAEVTMLSGRGVGMAAFRQRVLALHGMLEVHSVRGTSTTWIIRLPLVDAALVARCDPGSQAPWSGTKLSRVEGAGGRR
jgi:chemotaxis protein histidine kinase CheA